MPSIFAQQLGRGFEPCSLLCGQRVGVEAKRTIAPAMTRSLHPAPSDLRLDRAFVLIPGEARFGCTSAWRRWG